MIITQIPNALNMTLYMKQVLMYLIMCWPPSPNEPCCLSVMSYAGEEEASEGAVGLLSVDMPIIVIIGIAVFIADHET
jgi:hypothetical protein